MDAFEAFDRYAGLKGYYTGLMLPPPGAQERRAHGSTA